MRHPVYRLATEGAGRPELRPTGRRAWLRTVVVPREACVFEQFACSGVAWHERRGFARLQAMRLAPFSSTGASAAVRNGQVMLWLWDKAEVDAAILAHGLLPSDVRTIAETLLLPIPKADAAFDLPTQGGVEHITLSRGAIVASRWEATRRSIGAAAPELLPRPWATDLLQASWWAASEGLDARRLALIAGWALASFSAAHLAYWAGTYLSVHRQIEALQRNPGIDSAELATITRLKAGERADAAWLQNYRRLTASMQIGALLDALETPLEANRLVIKEFEARDNDLRISLASVDNNIDLPAVLLALQRVPGIDAVQLRQNADMLQATYTMRPAGFRQPVFPPGATP